MKKPEKANPDRDVGASNSADEAVFNETLKRMLKTPPTPATKNLNESRKIDTSHKSNRGVGSGHR